MKHDGPLSEVLLPISMMDLIGNWKFKYSHTNDLSPDIHGSFEAETAFLYTFFQILALNWTLRVMLGL